MKMSHQSCKSFPHKHSLPKTSNDHRSLKTKSSCHAANAVHNCKPACSSSMNTDVHRNSTHKVRRLKTRKERNQVRDQERNRSHTYNQHSRKVGGEKAQCHHIHPLSCSTKERTFAKPLIRQKPSIITEGRLTSIRGLFSHKVRSIDIERLVSDQIKKDKQKKEQRKQFMMHITSPLSPPVTLPDSDQNCTLDEVQEPLQEQENNMPPHVKRKKGSRKELIGKNTGIRTNRGDAGPMGLSREDGKYDRNANTRKEDTSNKTRQDSPSSPRETEHVVLSSLENDPVHQLCSTPVETNKNNSDISQTDTLKSHDEGNQEKGFMNIQIFEKTSTMMGFPNMEAPQMLENLQTFTSLSELDSGAGQLADSVKHREQMSKSCREAVKRLARRLCQASELHVPSHRRPLLAECREVLMQTLQKRHGFQLEHNLYRLHSFLNEKQAASQLSSGQSHKDCSPFSHAVENEERCYSRNMEIWTDSAMQHNYLAEEVRLDLDRGASTKKRRIQEWNTSSPPFSLEEPQQSHTDMFDQWRAAELSQDFFRAQHHPSRHLFNQSQTFTQHAVPILRAPTWLDHPVNSYSQQQSLSTGESSKSVYLDPSRISQQCTEETDLSFNSYHLNESRKQKPQEPSFGGSRFWSNQQQVQDERERWAPFSFSASYLSEGFQYEPFFRCPHPSNTSRSDWLGMTQCPRSNTPFPPPLYL
ncbi:uncharacterized protein LOC130103642 [Rhinichthys klamathensis goyatoka]|uniref:uncharacterized protein LOC130103642 n=1 Tax=Rhinichthys klamathensis goyatoka TaxID=3034132 RepID=UPI0024B513F2|nr:uncharacterized protein LOC130103642 [Rhinichthys klamathensis goyatoka]